MNVFISGATGFIGRSLVRILLQEGHTVTGIGTRSSQDVIRHENFKYIAADTTQPGPWQDALSGQDIIVNLVGRSVFRRWSQRYKRRLYDSRILTTRNLVEALPGNTSLTFCSASATGFYGDGGEEILTELSPAGNDFLAQVSKDWEAEALQAESKNARVILTRFGIVLDGKGGMMQKVLPLFRLCVGGPLGNGRQWFPWIHMEDLLDALLFVLKDKALHGPFNFCSPQPVRNSDFTQVLGRVLKRPAFMQVPRFMLRVVMGEFADTILNSQRVLPERLIRSGFQFKYPDIESALKKVASG